MSVSVATRYGSRRISTTHTTRLIACLQPSPGRYKSEARRLWCVGEFVETGLDRWVILTSVPGIAFGDAKRVFDRHESVVARVAGCRRGHDSPAGERQFIVIPDMLVYDWTRMDIVTIQVLASHQC